MQRRQFITLAGGGAVLAATAGTVLANPFSSAYPAEAVAAWQGPAPGLDARRTALSYALTAPNPHNLQPWIADLRTPGQIVLRTDPKRVLAETDPFGRQITVGLGGFLALLRMALAEQGIGCEAVLWPEGELPANLKAWDDRPVAVLKLQGASKTDSLFAQVLKRRSAKVAYDTARSVPTEALALLEAAARPSDARLPQLQVQSSAQAERVAAMRKLCLDSAMAEINNEPAFMESMRLLRVGPAEIDHHRDGISINSPFVRAMAAFGMFDRTKFPQPGSPGHKSAVERFATHANTAMAFAWISGPNTRTGQLAAGEAHLRMHLRATALGIGLHPMSQALQEFPAMRSHYQAAHQLLISSAAPTEPGPSSATVVHMFNRLGYVKEAPQATPRRTLEVVVRA